MIAFIQCFQSVCFGYISNDHCYNSSRHYPAIHLRVERQYCSGGWEPGFEFKLCALLVYDLVQLQLIYLCLNISIYKIGIKIVPIPHEVVGRIKWLNICKALRVGLGMSSVLVWGLSVTLSRWRSWITVGSLQTVMWSWKSTYYFCFPD